MEKTRKQKMLVGGAWNMSGAKRLALWRRARAVWSKRKVDPIKELNKIRREWR